MKALIEKVAALLPLLDEKGAVYLLALFEREDVSGKWDIVLSSDWSDEDASGAVRFVSQKIAPQLKDDQLTALSRIVVIPSSEPSVSLLSSSVSLERGCMEISDSNFMGVNIKRAFLFRCKSPGVAPVAARNPA